MVPNRLLVGSLVYVYRYRNFMKLRFICTVNKIRVFYKETFLSETLANGNKYLRNTEDMFH